MNQPDTIDFVYFDGESWAYSLDGVCHRGYEDRDMAKLAMAYAINKWRTSLGEKCAIQRAERSRDLLVEIARAISFRRLEINGKRYFEYGLCYSDGRSAKRMIGEESEDFEMWKRLYGEVFINAAD